MRGSVERCIVSGLKHARAKAVLRHRSAVQSKCQLFAIHGPSRSRCPTAVPGDLQDPFQPCSGREPRFLWLPSC